MNVLVTGGTGFIGSALIHELLNDGHKIIVLTRNVRKARFKFDKNIKVIENLEQIPLKSEISGIVNLAGAPIDKRWSSAYKKKLLQSRIGVTKQCIALIKRLEHKPKWFISGSAVGYYGETNDTPLTEHSQPKAGFTHDLCQAWEKAALEASSYGVRVCLLRTGVVLGKNGGMIKKILLPFQLGLGGRVGNGKQWLSWASMEDIVSIIRYLMSHQALSGPFNACAPNPVQNENFTKTLAKVLHRPAWMPMPSFMVKLLFGEMGEALLLNGQRVMPSRLIEHGFKFKHPTLEQALQFILKK